MALLGLNTEPAIEPAEVKPAFRVVWRGYDRIQVASYVDRISDQLAMVVREYERAIAELNEENARLASRALELTKLLATPQDSADRLGTSVRQILRAAELEAQRIKQEALQRDAVDRAEAGRFTDAARKAEEIRQAEQALRVESIRRTERETADVEAEAHAHAHAHAEVEAEVEVEVLAHAEAQAQAQAQAQAEAEAEAEAAAAAADQPTERPVVAAGQPAGSHSMAGQPAENTPVGAGQHAEGKPGDRAAKTTGRGGHAPSHPESSPQPAAH